MKFLSIKSSRRNLFLLSIVAALSISTLPQSVKAQCGTGLTLTSGPLAVCAGQTDVTYTVAAVATATNYILLIPPGQGATVVSQNGRSIVVNFSPSFTSCTLVMYGIFPCGAGTTVQKTITASGANPPATPGIITGLTSVLPGQSLQYEVAAVPNALSYDWSLPAGATITSRPTPSSAIVNFPGSFTSGTIMVRALTAACTGSYSPPLSLSCAPAAAGNISGSTAVCINTTDVVVTYTVPTILNATSHIWTFTGGIPMSPPGNTLQLKFPANLSQNSVTISAFGTNSCGVGVASSTTVTINRPVGAAGLISGPQTVNQGQVNVTYSVPPIQNVGNYVWVLPSGVTSTGSDNTRTLTFPSSFSGGDIVAFGVSGPCGAGASSTLTVSINTPMEQQNRNSIVTRDIIKANVISDSQIPTLTSDEMQMSVTYLDGMGKSLQEVSWQASPSKKDVVTDVFYDDLGRNSYTFPSIVSTENNGLRKEGMLTQPAGLIFNEINYLGSTHYNFYNNSAGDPTYKIADDPQPYVKTIYENSPLGRVIQQGGIGAAWQPNTSTPGNAKTQKFTYGSNNGNEIRRWSINDQYLGSGISCDFYPANTLSVNTSIDDSNPQHQQTRKFTNSKGLIVLEQQQLDASTWIDTHYIYDKYDQLRVIIPPEASKVIKDQGITSIGQIPPGYQLISQNTTLTSTTGLFMYNEGVTVKLTPQRTWSPAFELKSFKGTANFYLLEQYAFQFAYDNIGRKIAEKSPGKEVVYYVYDKKDRLVLSQDGIQRLQNQWTFLKYDKLDRNILIGLVTINSSIDDVRAAVQNTTILFETTGSVVHGYTNNAYPSVTDENAYLSVVYYDDYNFKSLIGNSFYNYKNDELPALSTAEFLRVKGFVTGTKTKILDPLQNTWLWAVSYYNDNLAVQQIVAGNHNGGIDRITSKYNFAGWITSTRTSHDGSTSKDVIEEYEYDSRGRLLNQYHQLGTDPLQRKKIVAVSYNELGETIQKKIHVNPETGVGFQHVDFRHTIKGSLKGINTTPAEVGDPVEYFSQELAYENSLAGSIARYDGLVSASKWKADVSSKSRSYNYNYDNLSRLKDGNFKSDNGANTWTSQPDFYSEKSIGYDLNGNITNIKRYEKETTATQLIDDLVFDYGMLSTKGNQLKMVTDIGTAKGFSDDNIGSEDYAYDRNGNLLFDRNKGIKEIKYNNLNLPEKIIFSVDNSYIQYMYDAVGTKLRQTNFNANNQILTKTDFIGEQIYVNDVLTTIAFDGGRILPPAIINLIANREAGSLEDFSTQGSVSITAEYLNNQTYVKAICNQSSGSPGVFSIGQTYAVKAGESYSFKVLGYQSVGTTAQLYVNTNLGSLFIPAVFLPYGSSSETWSTVNFTIPVGATQLKLGVLFMPPTIGNTFYINRVALYKTDWEYQYLIADHLGSPRAVLSTNPSVLNYKANFETESQSDLQQNPDQQFLNVNYTNVIVHPSNKTLGGNEVIQMNSSYKVGPARSLKVYPGDKIDGSVNAYYDAVTGLNKATFTTMASSLITVMSGNVQAVVDGINMAYSSSSSGAVGFLLSPNQGTTKPSAFLNYILFDEDYMPLEARSIPLASSPGVSQGVALPTVSIKEVGILFVYLSYDNESNAPVYFDEFKIIHTESPLVQVNEYYPYGMNAYTWTREGEYENRFLYQGKEFEAKTKLHDFNARQYDASLGRWFAPDPLGQFVSPYSGMGNNPVSMVDPDGRYVIVDDLIAAGIGGLINLGVNLFSGNLSGYGLWETLGRSTAAFSAGAVSGWGAIYPEFGGWIWGGAIVGATNSWLSGATSATDIGIGATVGVISSVAGGAVGAGLSSSFTGITSPILRGVTMGAISGGVGGFAGGVAGGIAYGQDPLKTGWQGFYQGAIFGGTVGMIGAGYKAHQSGVNPVTGKSLRPGSTGIVGQNAIEADGFTKPKGVRASNNKFRFWDGQKGDKAAEAKVGYQRFNEFMKQQLWKDFDILYGNSTRVTTVEWRFYRSPVTNQVGYNPSFETQVNQYNSILGGKGKIVIKIYDK